MEQITNCGLIALRNINTLKNVSIRTLLNLAEDNGQPLFSYYISDYDILTKVKLPAIFHSIDHFTYVETIEDLKDLKLTGYVILSEKADYTEVPEINKINIQGGSWVAAGIASGAATNAAVMYVKKNRDAKRDAANRPKYQVPDEIKQNLNQAQQQSIEGLPEAQKQQYLSNLERGSAYGLSEIGSRNGGLAGVAALNQNQNDAYGNMLSMDANARHANQNELMNQRNVMADYKGQAFQFNQVDPYYENIAKRNSRDQQFSQSLNNAGQMMGGAMGGMGGGGKQQQSFNDPSYYPQNFQSPTTPSPLTNQNNNNFGGGMGYGGPNNSGGLTF